MTSPELPEPGPKFDAPKVRSLLEREQSHHLGWTAGFDAGYDAGRASASPMLGMALCIACGIALGLLLAAWWGIA